MSCSSRIQLDNDVSKSLELPVFVSPTELIFTPNCRRSLLTIFNPYGKEAQFNIMTTSPERFDMNNTKGILRPNRRIDIIIRLFSDQITGLPLPSDEAEIIDYFKIYVQIGPLKGNRQLKVLWCSNSLDQVETDNSFLLDASDGKPPNKIKSKQSKTAQSNKLVDRNSTTNQGIVSRSPRTPDNRGSYQANMVCTLGGLCCILVLFLPLSIDLELCKRQQNSQDDSKAQLSDMFGQLSNLFCVSYEMKLVCSFALGLFTYRLISTMPE